MKQASPQPVGKIRSLWARLFITVLCPWHLRQEIAGDLEELYRSRAARHGEKHARKMYLRDLRSLVRLTDAGEGNRSDHFDFLIAQSTKGESMIGALIQDIRYGLRTLAKSPGFTLVAVLTLALGIGANTTVFTVVHAVLLRQLPFAQPEQLVWVTQVRPDTDDAPFSIPEFLDYRRDTDGFGHLAALANWPAVMSRGGENQRVNGMRVSGDAFEMLGVKASLGRTLRADDDRPGAAKVVVLGDGLWKRRFASDPGIVGRALILNGETYEVAGVLPPQFLFPMEDAELAVPLSPETDLRRLSRTSVNFLRMIGRLKPGWTREAAQTAMNATCARLREQFPVEYVQRVGVKLTPLHDRVVGNYREALLLLQAAVMLVLLVACANLANLQMTRASSRGRELALRTALGASRSRLVRQLFTESIVLSVVGGVLGISLSAAAVPALLAFSPANLPRAAEIGIDQGALLFTGATCLLTGLLFGVIPATLSTRSNLNDVLKSGGRSGSDSRQLSGRIRNALAVAEITLALVLLSAGGLLLQSLLRAQRVEPGFEAGHVLSMRISLLAERYSKAEDYVAFEEQLRRRLAELPGIEAVGATSILPMSGPQAAVEFSVAGRPPLKREEVPVANFRLITPGYLQAMRIPVLKGRDFSEQDNARSRPVMVINQELAGRFFPNQDPLGAELVIDDSDQPRKVEIVGVVGNVKEAGLDAAQSMDLYVAALQIHPDVVGWSRNNQFWVIRGKGEEAAFAQAARGELAKVDPQLASTVKPVNAYLQNSLEPRRFNLGLLLSFAAIALVLAVTGLYGVLAFSVAQRTREIGIRMALGAQRQSVLLMVLKQGGRLLAVGLGLGLLGAFAAGRLISNLLYGVKPNDPATLLGVAAVLSAVTLLASWIPAWRASRVDPLVALRYE